MRRAKQALSRVSGAVKKLTGRLHKHQDQAAPEPAAARTRKPAVQTAERKRRPQADIPVDTLAAAYIPTQTSLKAPFRADGAERQSDQEFARGVADDRWNDEDHFTNKSGDPRIGTHGRTYEPGESRLDPNGRR